MAPDTVSLLLLDKGFALADTPDPVDEYLYYNYMGESYLSRDIPINGVHASFRRGQLIMVSVDLYRVYEENYHFQRLRQLDSFIRSTYFIDSGAVAIDERMRARVKDLTLTYESNRFRLTITSSFGEDAGYGLQISYYDKWADRRTGRRAPQ
jgi:hypothetical protein